jgi:hypothetical protein
MFRLGEWLEVHTQHSAKAQKKQAKKKRDRK